MGRIVILAGPSCVGKSPLWHALQRLHADLVARLKPVVLYNSREPRPGEEDGVDYHFRAREDIESMRGVEGVFVMDVRGDLQAVDFREQAALLASGDLLYEGNPFMARELLRWARAEGTKITNAFISPLSADELRELPDPEKAVAALMHGKLLGRMRGQKGALSPEDYEEAVRRSEGAFRELQMAHEFDCVLVNHDGEDSEHWRREPLEGDARRVVAAVASLLVERAPAGMEVWREGDPV